MFARTSSITHWFGGLGRRRWLLVLALVAALGLIAAACGGDDDEDDQAAAQAQTEEQAEEQAQAQGQAEEEQAQTGEALKIGFLADFSGPLAEFGPVIQTGVELALKHINDAGGVLGQPVSFVTGDTQVDTTQGLEEARRLVEVEGVHAIVGPLSSTVTIAVAESVTGPAGVPTISPSATSPAVSVADDNGYLFRSTISDAAQGVVLAGLAAAEGYSNVGVIFRNDAYGQGLADAFEAAFGGAVTAASIEQGATSYLAELQAAADGDAPVLVAIGFPEEALIFIREALENDIFSEFLFVDGTKSQDLIDGIGAEFLDGFKGTAPGAGPESPATRAWDDAYIAEFGELPTRPFVREAYDATIAIALAVELAGSVDGQAIRDALPQVAAPGGAEFTPGAESIAAALAAIRSGNDVNYQGAATTLDWNATGDVTTGFIEIWQYIDGTPAAIEEVAFDLGAPVAPAVAAPAAPAGPDTALKIGFLADFSGPLAEFGPVIQTGVELAIKHINDAGGVFGRPVEFVIGDTQVDTTQGLEEARRLVDIEGVHAIVGPLSSTVTIAVAESVTGPAGVPTISPSATSPAVSVADDDGYLFRSTISDAAQGVILADLAIAEGYDNVGVIFRNDAYGQGLNDAFVAAFAALGGAATSASIEQGATSYLSELGAAADGDAPVLVAIGFPTEALIFVREALENDIFSEFLFVDGTKSQDLIDGIGADFLNGFKGTAPGPAPRARPPRPGTPPTSPNSASCPRAPSCVRPTTPPSPSRWPRPSPTPSRAPPSATRWSSSPLPGAADVIPVADGIAAGLAAVRNGDDVNYQGAATTLDWNEAGDVTTGFIEIWQYVDGAPASIDEIAFDLN